MKFPDSGNFSSGPEKSGIGKPELAIPTGIMNESRLEQTRGAFLERYKRPRFQFASQHAKRENYKGKVLEAYAEIYPWLPIH